MTARELIKSKSTPREIGNGLSQADLANDLSSQNGSDQDIFAFLSSINGSQINSAAVHVLASRKRKFLDQGGSTPYGSSNSSGKFFSGLRSALNRRNSDDDPPLHTPQCSQSGYADEEDRRHSNDISNGDSDVDDSNQLNDSNKNRLSILSPGQSTIIADIDENLAADFDGSLSGLGVDINSSTYSMSEALMALPNLTTSTAQIFKQEIPSPPTQSAANHGHHPNLPAFTHHNSNPIFTHHNSNRISASHLKEEPNSKSPINKHKNSKIRSSPLNYGALDLSSDEAAHFPESETSEDATVLGPKTFTGSVTRVGTPNSHGFQPLTTSNSHQQLSHLTQSLPGSFSAVNLSASHPNLTMIGSSCKEENISNASSITVICNENGLAGGSIGSISSSGSMTKSHKVILPLQNPNTSPYIQRKDSQEHSLSSSSSNLAQDFGCGSAFQFTLNASTSIATKINEPSITYLNQGQAYELTLKKFGDQSFHRKRLLKCQLRVGFHERRLQYMEMEHINEWSAKHPTERILDIDIPLSYGIIDPVREPSRLNVVTFKWDPSRDTGIFIKVNCISTEFTPKKHGGEKGVPFRLQIETFDLDESRLYAAGCILQVFKLKGADRKHKQDRDKIQKRPQQEQEKFSRPFGYTVLTELPPECIYNPQTSRSASPESLQVTSNGVMDSSVNPSRPRPINVRDDSNGIFYVGSVPNELKESFMSNGSPTKIGFGNGVLNTSLTATSTVEAVTMWLGRNRYSTLIPTFRNYSGRDVLRLSREDIISMCGMSEGLRLYNDLHMVSVSPRSTFYIALKDSMEYDALFLDELSLNDFVKKMAQCIGIELSSITNVYKRTNRGFIIRVSDAVIQYSEPESVFIVNIRSYEDGKVDIVLEDAAYTMQDTQTKMMSNNEVTN